MFGSVQHSVSRVCLQHMTFGSDSEEESAGEEEEMSAQQLKSLHDRYLQLLRVRQIAVKSGRKMKHSCGRNASLSSLSVWADTTKSERNSEVSLSSQTFPHRKSYFPLKKPFAVLTEKLLTRNRSQEAQRGRIKETVSATGFREFARVVHTAQRGTLGAGRRPGARRPVQDGPRYFLREVRGKRVRTFGR